MRSFRDLVETLESSCWLRANRRDWPHWRLAAQLEDGACVVHTAKEARFYAVNVVPNRSFSSLTCFLYLIRVGHPPAHSEALLVANAWSRLELMLADPESVFMEAVL